MNKSRHKITSQFTLVIISLYFSLALLFSFIGYQANPKSGIESSVITPTTTVRVNESFWDKNPQIWLSLICAISGLPILLLALYVVKRKSQNITSSLSTAVNSLDEIAIGNFDFKLDNLQTDETGHLLEAMKMASSKLKSFVIPMEQGIQNLSIPLEQLSKSSHQCKNILETQEQLSSDLDANIIILTKSFQKSVGKSSNTSNIKQDENFKTSTAIAEISQSLQVISSVSADIDQVASVISELQTSSAAIGSVIESINQIANQTNMLALNAAIEAARAGDQGRGFAVVADEVRNLSSKTHDATTQIQSTIKKIQSDTNQAVIAIEKTKESISIDAFNPSSSLQQLQEHIDFINSSHNIENGEKTQIYLSELMSIKNTASLLSNASHEFDNHIENIISQSKAISDPVNQLSEKITAMKVTRKFSHVDN